MSTITSPLHSAASDVVSHLAGLAPQSLWVLSRIDGAHLSVVAAAGQHSERTPVGFTTPWLGSFALHLVAGNGPAVAPDVTLAPSYAAVGHGERAWVRAFAGAPVLRAEDDVFGVLCGMSGVVGGAGLGAGAAMLPLFGRLLSALVTALDGTVPDAQALRSVRLLASSDGLTGLLNRRGWDAALLREARRSRRQGRDGGHAGVLVVDLDGLTEANDTLGHEHGDRLLRDTAHVLSHACRPTDEVARCGGDEFAVLAHIIDDETLDVLAGRIDGRLRDAGIAASMGVAAAAAGETPQDTWGRADVAMLADKVRRRELRLRAPWIA